MKVPLRVGFSLHAGVWAGANDRAKLERLCRYIARPAVSNERIALTECGHVRYTLKTPYRDGTTHVLRAGTIVLATGAEILGYFVLSVDDPRRVEYLRSHMAAVGEAADAGVDVRGFFVWSFLDNFEWAEGYRPRFGLVYTDYATQQRIPKTSYQWFRSFLRGDA